MREIVPGIALSGILGGNGVTAQKEIRVAESPQTRCVVVLDSSQVSPVRERAAAQGVKVEEIRELGIEPVVTVTLVLVGAAAAVHAVLRLVEQLLKGGQVIDLRPGAAKAFYRTKDVTYGIVIVVAVDGQVTVTVKDPDGMFGKVISTLPQLLSSGGSATEVVGAVTKTFGADVQIDAAGIPAKDGEA